MGCKYCTSGLGKDCYGPLGLDDLEVNCHCSCHECNDCSSAYCEYAGGHIPCKAEGCEICGADDCGGEC